MTRLTESFNFVLQVADLKEEQDKWLDQELSADSTRGSQHLVVFQHIPWFLYDIDEDKQYFNIDISTRKQMMKKFHSAGKLFI